MKFRHVFITITILAAMLPTACGKKKKETLDDKLKAGKFTIKEVFENANALAARKKYIDARKWYRLIETHAPNSDFFSQAKLGIADTYFFDRTATTIEASVEYKSFLTHFPNSPLADYVQYQYAMCFYTEIESATRDQTSTWTAYNEFKKVIDNYPGSPYAAKAKAKMDLCLTRIAQHEFEVGYYYFRRGKGFEISAEARFKSLIDEYEGFYDQEKTYFYLGETLWRLNKYDEAIRYYNYLDRNHTESEFTPFVNDKIRRYAKISEEGMDPGLTEDLGDTPDEAKNF
ncbi:MAG: hypothetical protein CSA81_06165 [Acidobacteria bacterium]|nr:MAG: hypothetical protein CSA81_06165 [Acidobacteriota bacterium]PIE90748.1 MAG: hypothetical protein CR997_04855 [Acidobacteriota bacterium]